MRDGGKRLTPKQQKFCENYIQTGNATEAYKMSYDAGKMKPATINRKATELMQNGTITAFIAEMQARSVEKAELTKAWVLERLMKNVRISLGEETVKLRVYSKMTGDIIEGDVHLRDAAAANRALELLGKELKMFTDRQEITGQLTWEQIVLSSYKTEAQAQTPQEFAPGEKLSTRN